MKRDPLRPGLLIVFLLLVAASLHGFQSKTSKQSLSHALSFLQSVQESEKRTKASSLQDMGGSVPPRNLKSAGHNPARDDSIIQGWKELKGLSEKPLLLEQDALGAGRAEQALDLAYRRCEYVTQLFSKTFYVGSSLMPAEARKHVWAVYAWCRRTDDLVDSPRALLSRDDLRKDLREWEERLEAIWTGRPVDLFDLAMADTVRAYPSMHIQPYRDMIQGMLMDVPGLGQDRYKNFDELYLYCYRVAGTVGLMTLPILGLKMTGKSESEQERYFQEASQPAIALGIGLQLTNILRDVGEDLERGRIYLPQDELQAFGLTEEDIASCKVTERYKELMRFQIQRARDYYKIAAEGVHLLAPQARFAVQASLDLYSRILDVIERNQYDNFNKRAFTTKFEKLGILPGSLIKSQFSPKI